MGIVRHKDPFLLIRIPLLQISDQFHNAALILLKCIPHIRINDFIGQGIFPAGDLEPPGTSGRRHFIRQLRIHVDQDIAAAFLQQARSLHAAHVVVRIDTGDVLVLTLDPNHRHAVCRQFF